MGEAKPAHEIPAHAYFPFYTSKTGGHGPNNEQHPSYRHIWGHLFLHPKLYNRFPMTRAWP
jgi:hypothetical protein